MTNQNEKEIARLVEIHRRLFPRKRVLEIGSLEGETLKLWIEMAEAGSRIVAVDMLVPTADPRYAVQKDGHEVMWPSFANAQGIQLYVLDRDSSHEHTVQLVKYLLPVVDFLFIDGGHDYATTKSDWLNYSPLVRAGGVIAFHDLGREWPDVRRVWEEVRIGHESQEIVESNDQYGIGVLWK